MSFVANNNLASAEDPGETQAVLVPLLGDAANLNVTPADYQHAQFYAAYEHVNVRGGNYEGLRRPGDVYIFAQQSLAGGDKNKK